MVGFPLIVNFKSKRMVYLWLLLISATSLIGRIGASTGSCYFGMQSNRYTCAISTASSHENEITDIGGAHMSGKTNNDVTFLAHNSVLVAIPVIFCQTFLHLEIIDLSGRGIQSVTDNSFNKCLKIKELYLNNNRIDVIGANVFPNRLLTTLTLQGNEINKIEDGAFRTLKYLTTLTLNNNYITNIAAETFEGLEKVTSLPLQINRFTEIPAEAFKHLTSLTSLQLNDNNIMDIAPRAFDGLGNLTDLYLHNNLIFDILDEAFYGLEKLTTLHLHNNFIDIIHPDFLVSLPNNQIIIDLRNNFCINSQFIFIQPDIINIAPYFVMCFENYGDATSKQLITQIVKGHIGTTNYRLKLLKMLSIMEGNL